MLDLEQCLLVKSELASYEDLLDGREKVPLRGLFLSRHKERRKLHADRLF